MDAHLDSTVYQTSFGLQDPDFHLTGNVFTNTMSHFLQVFHEYSLPDDVVEKAVHGACDFLHMDDLEIKDSKATGVFVNDPTTLSDDVLGFSRQQLLDLGVHDEKTLSLICTHEAAHCLLQNLSSTHYLTDWQTELSCDAFMGARAAIEGLDLEKVKATLCDTKASTTHPDGQLRLDYLEHGRKIGEELRDKDIPITADNIMARISTYLQEDASKILHQEVVAHEVAADHRGSSSLMDSGEQKGYTREEINRKISKAKLDMAREESNMRHWKHMTNSKFEMGEPNSVEASAYKSAHDRYIKAKDDLWKWEHTHAEVPKGFVDVNESIVDRDSFHEYTVKSAQADMDAAQAEMKKWEGKGMKGCPAWNRAKANYDQAEMAKNTAAANEAKQNRINSRLEAERLERERNAINNL